MTQRTCSVDGCEKPAGDARGWCSMHYARWYRTGTPLRPTRALVCSVEECERPHDCKGLCELHYRRLRRPTPEQKARTREYNRAYRQRNHETIKAYQRAYQQERSGERAAYLADWHQRNKAAEYQKAKQRRLANPEREREYARRWRANNPEESRRQAREYGRRNKDRRAIAHKAWCLANPEKRYANNTRSRVRRQGGTGDVTPSEWSNILAKHDYRCFYCGNQPRKLHQDHMIPLSRGGTHTKENVAPACPTCNQRKFTKTAEEFFAYLRSGGT